MMVREEVCCIGLAEEARPAARCRPAVLSPEGVCLGRGAMVGHCGGAHPRRRPERALAAPARVALAAVRPIDG